MAQATTAKTCEVCHAAVSFAEELDIGHGISVHLKCFKCAKCNVQLSPSDKYQLTDHGFYCKDHKGGLAKQMQERAKRSLRTAIKGAPKLFSTPSGKQKPPKEVGVPTTVPLDSPFVTVEATTAEEEEATSPVVQATTPDQKEGDDFVTVIDDADEPIHPAHLQLQTSHPSSPASSALMANPTDFQTTSLRRSSTVASTPSVTQVSASPSMLAYGEIAAIMPTLPTDQPGAFQEIQTPRAETIEEEVPHAEQTSQMSSPVAVVSEEERDEEHVVEPTVTSPEIEEQAGSQQNSASEEEPVVDQLPSEDESRLPSEIEEDTVVDGGDDYGGSTVLDSHSVAMLQDEDSDDTEVEVGEDEGEEDEDNGAGFDDDNEDEESPEKPPKPSDPLNVLTAAVAKELEILPQAVKTGESDEDQEEVEQPWVYPPAFSGVSPIQISVVDPDHLWMFLESPLLERMLHSKVGGARRAKFVASDALKPIQAVPIYSRYRSPYLHMYLVRCETIQEYTSTVRPRLKAFREDVEHREDPEWLLVLVESSAESKKVFDKMKQDFSKERVVTVSVSDDQRWIGREVQATKLRPAGDGQWGDLAQRVGTSIVRAYEHRRPLYKKAIDEEVEREMDWNYFSVFTKVESLAFASLQVDRYEEALDLYMDLSMRFRHAMEQRDPLIEKIVRCGMTDESGSSVKRLPCAKLLFPAVSTRSTEQDAIRAQIHRTFPARIFDVERLPFRDLIGTSTVSGIQLQMYLMSRIVLNLLALGRAREAIETSRQFLFALRANLRLAYPKDLTCIDAWMVAASLEVVAAGHACASVFASEVDPSDRVGMCLAQAILLERARSAMEDISARECPAQAGGGTTDKPGGRKLIPDLALNSHSYLLKETNLPVGLARAFYSSPESFRNMYGRLLEASAAHFVAAGRFRFAASLTHRRAILLSGSKRQDDAQLLFEDAGRWWGGGAMTVVFGQGTADVGTALHDSWPSLRAETCLYTGHTDRIAKVVELIQPAFRRRALATKIHKEMKEDALLPIELRAEFTAEKFTEDELWRGEIEVRWCLPEMLSEKGLFAWKDVDKVLLRFKSAASTSGEAKEIVSVDFVAHVAASKTDQAFADRKTFTATSTASCAQLGAYLPAEAYVWIRGMRLRVLPKPVAIVSPVLVVERPFPFVAEVTCPKLVASGTSFCKQTGENDAVSSRQQFMLHIKKRDPDFKLDIGECEATVTLSEGMELCEDSDGKASVTSLLVRFDKEMSRTFTVVVAAKNKQGSGLGAVFVDLKSLRDSRTAPKLRADFTFHPPIQVTHDIRFAGNDVAAISLLIENNLSNLNAGNNKTGMDVEVLGCTLTNISKEETVMKSSPVNPFPFHLTSLCTLRQAFLLYGLNAIVPERVGGKSLIILMASVDLKFPDDGTQCTLSWYVPLLVRRADVVRQRWKEGESFSFSPPIEDASFGMDWKEIESDDVPIVIDESMEEDAAAAATTERAGA